jgi:hypothetical protein
LLQLFPRSEFEIAVKKHKSDYSAKGFSSWAQFVAMEFCQFGRAHSHREICGGLARREGKLTHLGVSDAPKRSTLSYAKDLVVFFRSQATPDSEHFFRIVEIWDEEKERSFTFLTHNMEFRATTIAAIAFQMAEDGLFQLSARGCASGGNRGCRDFG